MAEATLKERQNKDAEHKLNWTLSDSEDSKSSLILFNVAEVDNDDSDVRIREDNINEFGRTTMKQTNYCADPFGMHK